MWPHLRYFSSRNTVTQTKIQGSSVQLWFFNIPISGCTGGNLSENQQTLHITSSSYVYKSFSTEAASERSELGTMQTSCHRTNKLRLNEIYCSNSIKAPSTLTTHWGCHTGSSLRCWLLNFMANDPKCALHKGGLNLKEFSWTMSWPKGRAPDFSPLCSREEQLQMAPKGLHCCPGEIWAVVRCEHVPLWA